MDSAIAILLPEPVEEALTRLRNAGFSAYTVGGCVRDSLLGREVHDWDLTASSTPDQTEVVFSDCHVIEIGKKHGTVTVLSGGMNLEITTFRNDGIYTDNRHPENVTFSDRVEDDLARRDFTVNAMAYRPGEGLVDLFGGRNDLKFKIIRCVGDPAARFREDGLRILRAVRFASVLDFSIEEKTARAVHSCKALLNNIAAERVREEFFKLLCGRGAVRILREYPDVIAQFLPEIGACVGFAQNSRYHQYDVYEHTLHALEFSPADLLTRLAILFHDVGKPLCYTEDASGGHFKGHGNAGTELTESILRRLRCDNATVATVTKLVEWHDRDIPAEPRAVRRLMSKLSDAEILRLVELKRCDRLAHAPGYSEPPEDLLRIPSLLREIRDSDACLSLRTLRINGNDLIAIGIPPGKQIGSILRSLLDRVIDGTLENDRAALLDAAKDIANVAK